MFTFFILPYYSYLYFILFLSLTIWWIGGWNSMELTDDLEKFVDSVSHSETIYTVVFSTVKHLSEEYLFRWSLCIFNNTSMSVRQTILRGFFKINSALWKYTCTEYLTPEYAHKHTHIRTVSFKWTHTAKVDVLFDNTSVINGVGCNHLKSLNSLPSLNSTVAS